MNKGQKRFHSVEILAGEFIPVKEAERAQTPLR